MTRDEYLQKTGQIIHLRKRVQGRLDSWWEEGKSRARTSYYTQVNAEEDQLLGASVRELQAMQLAENKRYLPERNAEQRAIERVNAEATQIERAGQTALFIEQVNAERQNLRADSANKLAVSRAASAEGKTPEVYLLHKTMELQDRQERERIQLEAKERREELRTVGDLEMQKMRLDGEIKKDILLSLANLDDQKATRDLERRLAEKREESYLRMVEQHQGKRLDYETASLLQRQDVDGKILMSEAEKRNAVMVERETKQLAAGLIHDRNMAHYREVDELNDRHASLKQRVRQARNRRDWPEFKRLKKQMQAIEKAIDERYDSQ